MQDLAAGAVIRMSRLTSFSSAHFYKQNKWTEAENQATFGACFTPHGHGHNYVLEAFFEGPIDTKTGLLVNLIDIDRVLKKVTAPLDHHHLNFDVPYFAERVPTTEVMAQYLFDEIGKAQLQFLPEARLRLYKIRLFETDDIWVEVQS
jgi:6-pyruvoyltetrahydropterin/6-carboxytetrahydropterin synthase